MTTTIYDDEQRMFRDAFRDFLQREAAPFEARWRDEGVVSREVWRKAGANGFLAPAVPELYGGIGVTDFRYNAIISEELAYAHISSLGFSVHSDIAVPYLIHLGNEAQKQRWLPRAAAGELICAIAMTEPNTGSDLQAVQTTAIKQPDGSYLLVAGTDRDNDNFIGDEGELFGVWPLDDSPELVGIAPGGRSKSGLDFSIAPVSQLSAVRPTGYRRLR